MTWRILTALAATVLLAAVAIGYTLLRASPAPGTPQAGLTLDRPGLLLRDAATGRLAVQHADGHRDTSALDCARVYAASGTGVCLHADPLSPQLIVLDRDLTERRRIPLNGLPNRARVSASGRMVSWTVFVTGDSYNGGRFSTRSGILDTRTGTLAGNLENFTVDGRKAAPDTNVWGVTFTADDNLFYATVFSDGRRRLARGDFAARDLHPLKDEVECPSLSPDGTRIAYKKMLSDGSWRLTVLDLADLAETPTAETRSVDDQAAWIDGHTLGYALPHAGAGADVWTVPADGTGTPRLLAPGADSPAPLG
ncbi:TolB family protein [Kitasatospora camelliae]|uniref:WD40 repeat protein n=1 Tax=Kitasatospora camelliae TaxID=3156397 RepID=A0AAU8K427_9ACTN